MNYRYGYGIPLALSVPLILYGPSRGGLVTSAQRCLHWACVTRTEFSRWRLECCFLYNSKNYSTKGWLLEVSLAPTRSGRWRTKIWRRCELLEVRYDHLKGITVIRCSCVFEGNIAVAQVPRDWLTSPGLDTNRNPSLAFGQPAL